MMAAYSYTAQDETGKVFSGIYEDISSLSTLRSELAKIGYSLIHAKKKKVTRPGSIRIKQAEVVAFAFKFAGMCGAGLSIVQCLDTLEKQADNESLKFVIGDIRKNVESGLSLTNAFDKYRDIFSVFFLGMIEAGESSGKLAESLEVSAKYLEERADLANRLKSAFTYPVIVMIMCFAVVATLVTFIVPVFSKIYKQLGVSLPGPTQMLLTISVIVRHWWPFLIVPVFIVPIIYRYIRKSSIHSYVKSKWDYFKFTIPVFGKLNRLIAVSHFIRSFAMLISTGVPIIKALQVASLVTNNEKMSQISLDMQKSIQMGGNVAESLEKHEIFPPLVIQLAGSGEQAGVLGQMLNKGVDFLEKDIERTLNALLVKLEPVLTLGMGVIIGLVLIAVYLPMFDYMSHLK